MLELSGGARVVPEFGRGTGVDELDAAAPAETAVRVICSVAVAADFLPSGDRNAINMYLQLARVRRTEYSAMAISCHGD